MAAVLVADDEVGIVRFVSRALSREGIVVDTAPDGTAALAAARHGRHRVVVLDLRMPGLDGAQVLAELVRERPEQRVIMLSAIDDVPTKVRCLSLGAVDYLPKPFAVAELVARVQVQLRTDTMAVTDRTLRSGQLCLDLRRRVVEDGGRAASLSQREFLLLQYLMGHIDEVCSREELLAEVWGYSFDPGSNVVDVYIRRLRAKLSAAQIETVRNVGYVLLAS
ncbi:MAG: response regulator transcription factor [Actinomycetes bacterium]